MAMKSSFLPRISLSRGDQPLLPIHEQNSPPIHLSDLSPHADDPPIQGSSHAHRHPSPRRNSSPAATFSDRSSTAGSVSKLKPRAMFAGPPPPIARSKLLYRDEEDATRSSPRSDAHRNSALTQTAFGSFLFERGSQPRTREPVQVYQPDTHWRGLQRREKALQKELQRLLDAQSAGLAAHLDLNLGPADSQSATSDARSSTPTGALHSTDSTGRRSHVTFASARADATGEVMPVRQPRQKSIGLRGARAGLARNMALLADLKAEEDATLVSALSSRKTALTRLRKLSAQREGITGELRELEYDGEEPLARELRELNEEQAAVSAEVSKLEERLVVLRNRKKWLDDRIGDVRNRREAGLSGYRGALREVEGRVSDILRRPPITPLDLEAMSGSDTGHAASDSSAASMHLHGQSPGGVEFLRMRPERRTVGMAKDWWEKEVDILEQRKSQVDKERSALEEGAKVWKEAIKSVSDFENSLRDEMREEADGEDKRGGRGSTVAPEHAMYLQLDKMARVMDGLEGHVQKAESEGWNLLICAIGAELEAFREAEHMLRDALKAAGFDVEDEGIASAQPGGKDLVSRSNTSGEGTSSKDGQQHEDDANRRNNDVPMDLLVSHLDDHDNPTIDGHDVDRDDSENEVPPEFLAEHL